MPGQDSDEIRYRIVLDGLDEARRDVDKFRGSLRRSGPRGRAGLGAPPSARGMGGGGGGKTGGGVVGRIAGGMAGGGGAGVGSQLGAGAAKLAGTAAVPVAVVTAIVTGIIALYKPAIETFFKGMLAEFSAERAKLEVPGKAAEAAMRVFEPRLAMGFKPSQRQIDMFMAAEMAAEDRVIAGGVAIHRTAAEQAVKRAANTRFFGAIHDDGNYMVNNFGRR